MATNFYKELLDDENCGDVIIKYKGGQRRVIGSILTKRSDYFAAMLMSQMAEGQTKIIEMPEVTRGGLDFALHQLYLGEIPDRIPTVEARDAYCLMHQWDLGAFMEQYDTIIWTHAPKTLKIFLEKYPATEKLCMKVIEQIRKERLSYTPINYDKILEDTDNLTRRVLVFMCMAKNVTMTPEVLRNIYGGYVNSKKRKIDVVESGDV